MPVGFRSMRHAFSLKRQADVSTEVPDADVDKQRGDIEYAPFGFEQIANVSDANQFGKVPFGSFRETLHTANVINSVTRPASDLDMLFTSAFVMGNHVAAQPDALLLPATWTHTMTWIGHGAKPQMDYTSFLELMGDGTDPGYQQKLIGAWLGQFSLSLSFGDFVTVGFQGGAREGAPSVAAMPVGVTVASLFKSNLTQLSFGDSGGEVNVDGRWTEFNLEFNTNPARVLRSGQPAGEEEFIERADRGNQTLTGSVTFELEDVAFRQKFQNSTLVGITINLQSDDLVDGARKSMSISMPNVKLSAADHGQAEETSSYTVTLDETSVLQVGAVEPVTIVLTTDIDDTEIFAT